MIMSKKNLDRKGRWRSKTIAFRVSPEENEQINRYAEISGLTKMFYSSGSAFLGDCDSDEKMWLDQGK